MSEESTGYQTPKFCPQCGTPVKRTGAKFCSQCGKNFTKTGSDTDIQQPTPFVQESQSPYPAGTPAQPQASETGPSQQVTPYGRGLRERNQQHRPKRSGMVTPNDIRPVSTQLFSKEELKLLGFFVIAAFISHLMRYFILFNEFPNLGNLLIPIPFYIVTVGVIFISHKYFSRDRGLQINYSGNEFDVTRSVVFSSFFLTLIPPKITIDKELSNIPEEVYSPVSGQYGMAYQAVPRQQYVGSVIRPRMHFWSNLVLLVYTFLTVILYFNISDPVVSRVIRLVSIYISSYIIVEIAPVFGRNNEKSGEYGRLRTLLIFFVTLIFFVIALLGETFFLALQDRF